jgi:NADPH:quinone reductase-like Zn-dependent oxidoreductase
MKAIRYDRYGSPDVLRLQEVDMPTPKDDQVVVRVRASSVNALDWRSVRASPFLVRLAGGLRKPKDPSLGADVSGVVEALGKNANEFHRGDEVFGLAHGAFGEYASAAERGLILKPAKVPFEAAAVLPIAGFTALQALRDTGQLRRGQSVLINGAGGGVGTFAVQIAKSFGAEVTAVSRSENLDLLRSMGADHVIDYGRQDFTRAAQQYDLILDTHPSHSTAAYKRVLTPGGICVVVGFAGMLRLISLVIRTKLWSKSRGRRVAFMMAKPNKKDLTLLAELVESGQLVPTIDRRYSLAEVPESIRYMESGNARGKIVITIGG